MASPGSPGPATGPITRSRARQLGLLGQPELEPGQRAAKRQRLPEQSTGSSLHPPTLSAVTSARSSPRNSPLPVARRPVIGSAQVNKQRAEIEEARSILKDIKNGVERFLPVHQEFAGRTLLHYAARVGDCDLINKLLDAGAHIDATGPGRRETPLVLAFESDGEAVTFLLDRGASPLLGNPLAVAAKMGNMPAVRRLLELGANVNERDWHGHTPLGCAALDANIQVVKLLLTKNANVNWPDVDGWSPLGLAIENLKQGSGGPDHGMLLRKADWAASGPALETMELLLVSGADANHTNLRGTFPLILAARKERLDAVMLLLKHGAEVDKTNRDSGRTALHVAAEGSCEDIMVALVNAGADINLRDANGMSVLGHSLLSDTPCVKTLLNLGADPLLVSFKTFEQFLNEGYPQDGLSEWIPAYVAAVRKEYEADPNTRHVHHNEILETIMCKADANLPERVRDEDNGMICGLLEDDLKWYADLNLDFRARKLWESFGLEKRTSPLLRPLSALPPSASRAVTPSDLASSDAIAWKEITKQIEQLKANPDVKLFLSSALAAATSIYMQAIVIEPRMKGLAQPSLPVSASGSIAVAQGGMRAGFALGGFPLVGSVAASALQGVANQFAVRMKANEIRMLRNIKESPTVADVQRLANTLARALALMAEGALDELLASGRRRKIADSILHRIDFISGTHGKSPRESSIIRMAVDMADMALKKMGEEPQLSLEKKMMNAVVKVFGEKVHSPVDATLMVPALQLWGAPGVSSATAAKDDVGLKRMAELLSEARTDNLMLHAQLLEIKSQLDFISNQVYRLA